MAHDLTDVAQHHIEGRHGALGVVHGLAIFALRIGIEVVGKVACLQSLRNIVQRSNGALNSGQTGVDSCFEFVHVTLE